MTSKARRFTRSSASCPRLQTVTSYPSCRSTAAQLSRRVCSSSTTRIRTRALASGPIASNAAGSCTSPGWTPPCVIGMDIALVLDNGRPHSYARFGPHCRDPAASPVCRTDWAISGGAQAWPHRPTAPRCIRSPRLIALNCGISPIGLRRRTVSDLPHSSRRGAPFSEARPCITRRGTRSMMSHLPLPPGSTPPVMVPPLPPPPTTEWGGVDTEGGVDWRRVFSAVLRFKWLICGVTVLGTMAGFGVARFVKPQFGAQATIWIDATEKERWGQGQDRGPIRQGQRSEEHTSELQSPCNLVCRLLLEKKKKEKQKIDSDIQ